jgi:hypothetical protein
MPSVVNYTPFLTPLEFVAPIRAIVTAAIRKTTTYCLSLLDSANEKNGRMDINARFDPSFGDNGLVFKLAQIHP